MYYCHYLYYKIVLAISGNLILFNMGVYNAVSHGMLFKQICQPCVTRCRDV